ncbi:MAG: DUF5667 domain-containing protein [Dehalococcoidales bacterium]|nr:DUF5667 domain-containing protein [Dehalococcoidales bacterium]
MDKNQIFENVLDECLEALISGTATVEQCLQKHPEFADELAPLLKTAASVNTAVDLKPSPAFKARARYQLQLMMAETAAPRKRGFWSLQPKWALASMAVMAVFLMGGGTVLAADVSMPGNPLYPIKIATENLSVKLIGSDVNKAELYSTLAERRVDEMAYVIENGKTTYVNVVADNFVATMTAMNSLTVTEAPVLTMSVAESASSFGAATIPETPSEAATASAPPAAALPSATVGQKEPAPLRAQGNEDKSAGDVTEDSNAPAPEITVKVPANSNTQSEKNILSIITDKDKLKVYITYNAINHPEKLQELLKKAPQAYKSTIQQMISNSITNNHEILEKLDD